VMFIFYKCNEGLARTWRLVVREAKNAKYGETIYISMALCFDQ